MSKKLFNRLKVLLVELVIIASYTYFLSLFFSSFFAASFGLILVVIIAITYISDVRKIMRGE